MSKLSEEEIMRIEQAQSKWFPTVLQSYSTSILDMMASPLKKSILFLSVYIFVIYLYLYVIQKQPKSLNSNILFILVGGLFIFGSIYYKQWKLNQNLIEVAMRSENRLDSKQFDFKNNMVVQGDLLTGSIGGGSSNLVDMVTGAYIMNDMNKSRKRRK